MRTYRFFIYLFILFFSLKSFSQNTYAKSYFVLNSGERIDCYIKKQSWKNNPTSFIYKLTLNDDVKKGSITTVKEFGAEGDYKYIKSNVAIDRSSSVVNELTYDKTPGFNKETLFLKLLVKGDANLYYYGDNHLKRFFFSTDNNEIKQLIYKGYKVDHKSIAYNNGFRMQILNSLSCENIKMLDVKLLEYNKQDLTKIFEKYNGCENPEFENFVTKSKKSALNLKLKAGISHNKLKIEDITRNETYNFNNVSNFQFGVELENVLSSFNNNKWALFLDLNYNHYSQSSDFIFTEDLIAKRELILDYNSVELGFGLRHYLFLNEKSKLYLNASFILDFPIGDSNLIRNVISEPEGNVIVSETRNIEVDTNLTFGFGYTYLEKYSIEFRVDGNRNFMRERFISYYGGASLMFSYTIL